jgi:hypothetical protein
VRFPTYPPSQPSGWHCSLANDSPRAARLPSANGLLTTVAVLFWFSPLTLLAWVIGQAVILRQRRWHWHRFALVALVILLVIPPRPTGQQRSPSRCWAVLAAAATTTPGSALQDGSSRTTHPT